MCEKWHTEILTHDNNYSAVPESDWTIPLDEMPSESGHSYTIASLKKLGNPYIVGCAEYTFGDSTAVHQTEFIAPLDIGESSVSARYIYAKGAN